MTIRTETMNEVKEWLEDNDYNMTLEEIIEGGWVDEDDNEIDFTAEEIYKIEEMILDHEYEEESREAEEAAENARISREWEIERRYQKMEYRAMVA